METGTKSRRIALILSYDGTAFHGYQIQDTGRTVQDDVERTLSIICSEKIRITAAGRTDAGVHALYQVVHFDTTSSITLQKICIGSNGILKKDVSVLNAFVVDENFHARYSAVSREYKYHIYNNKMRSPFMTYRALWHPEKLDVIGFIEILKVLEGTHDFASFCKKSSSDINTVRTIKKLDVQQLDDYLVITIKGNAFLHNMIRIIIGTTLDLIKNNGTASDMKEILSQNDRIASGKTASPNGLYLAKVIYEPDLESYESAFPV